MKNNAYLLRLRDGAYSVSSLLAILQIVIAASNFIITPLVIGKLGGKSYATWITINAFSGLLLLADWGFLNTFRVRMTGIYIQDKLFVRAIWKKANLYMHFSAVIGVFLLALTIRWGPLKSLDWQGQSLHLFALGLLTAYFTLFEHLYLVKFQILGSELKATSILVVIRTLEGVSQVLLLIIHPSVDLIFVIALIFRLGSLVTLALNGPKNLKALDSNSLYKTSKFEVLRESTGASMFVLSNVIYANVLTLVLSKVLTTELLIVVQISRMIVSPIKIIGSSVSMGTLQNQLRINLYNSKNSLEINRKTNLYFIYFLLLCAVLISILASPIWKVFFSNVTGFNQTLVILFAVQYVFDSLIWVNSREFYNKNRLFKLGLCNLALSSFGVLSIPVFFTHFEILGVPFSLVVFDILLLSAILSLKGRKWLLK